MEKEIKDLVKDNISKRAANDFYEFKKDSTRLACKYFKSRRESYTDEPWLNGPEAKLFLDFYSLLEKTAITSLSEKREKEFTEIMTNLGKYLEVNTQGL